jgi:hypothetical protein
MYTKSVRKREGKKQLRKSRHRWEDNTKLNLKEIDVRMNPGTDRKITLKKILKK